MKAHLLKVNPKRDASVAQLRKEFYYLRIATETVYKSRPLRSALPYHIFAEFVRRAAARSQFDLVMEEEERL